MISLSHLRKINRKILRGSSFAFEVHDDGDRLERDNERGIIRTLIPGGCRRLLDVGPVTYPAYTATSVSIRSRVEEVLDQGVTDTAETKPEPQPEVQVVNVELELLQMELEMEGIL